MRQSIAPAHFDPYSSPVEKLRRVIQQAGAGIRRSQNAIGRTTEYLEAAERFLTVSRQFSRSAAVAHELNDLQDALNRVGLQVAEKRTDLGMEVAELARLSEELQRGSVDPQYGKGA